jgi:hypothetical protein
MPRSIIPAEDIGKPHSSNNPTTQATSSTDRFSTPIQAEEWNAQYPPTSTEFPEKYFR